MSKRELVFRHPKDRSLDRYASIEVDGTFLVIREARLLQRDDPKRGSSRRTNMKSAESAASALRAQVEYRLKRGFVDLAVPASAPVKSSALRRWVDGLDASWRRFFLEALPDDPKKADAALKKILATKSLDVCTRQLTTLAPLARFTALTSVNASDNPDLADFAGLSKASRLKTLWLANTGLRAITDLPPLKSLEELSVTGTPIRDLSGVERYGKLTILHASNTRVASLSPVAGLVNVRQLYVASTKVADLSPLAKLTKLAELRVFMTPVADLTPLAALRGLTSVIASKTKIRSVMPLAALPKLKSLVVVGTKLTTAEKSAFERAKKGVLKQRGGSPAQAATP